MTGIVITVREESNRIERKASAIITGLRAIDILLHRLRSKFLSDCKIIVATPKGDIGTDAEHYYGEPESPLHRLASVAKKYEFDNIVRVTVDDILIDPFLLSRQIMFHRKNNLDYTYMGRVPTGTAAEIISSAAIIKLADKIKEPCEFISYYLKTDNYEYKEFYPPIEYQKIFRICLDFKDDLKLLRAVFSILGPDFGTLDLIHLYKKSPGLFSINNLPEITFYTCVYNMSLTIGKTIRSIMSTDLNFEYILYDDGSTDNTLTTAVAEISKYPEHKRDRVRIYSHENRGLSITGNQCLDLAKGKYIMRVDADDYLLPGAVEKMMSEIIGNDAVQSGYSRGEEKNINEHHDHSGCALFKTRLVQEYRYQNNLQFAKGKEFMSKFRLAHNVKFIPKVLWEYRPK